MADSDHDAISTFCVRPVPNIESTEIGSLLLWPEEPETSPAYTTQSVLQPKYSRELPCERHNKNDCWGCCFTAKEDPPRSMSAQVSEPYPDCLTHKKDIKFVIGPNTFEVFVDRKTIKRTSIVWRKRVEECETVRTHNASLMRNECRLYTNNFQIGDTPTDICFPDGNSWAMLIVLCIVHEGAPHTIEGLSHYDIWRVAVTSDTHHVKDVVHIFLAAHCWNAKICPRPKSTPPPTVYVLIDLVRSYG